jgi:SOS-response transcriptional repressor LexA
MSNHEKETFAYRLNRLLDLNDYRIRGRAKDFNAALGLGLSDKAVKKWLDGESKPTISKLKLIADILNTTVEHLIYGEPALETLIVENGDLTKANGVDIPLIDWIAVNDFISVESFKGEIEAYYPCPVKNGKNTFALKVKNLSMYPEFLPDEIIYIDPAVTAKDSSFVVVSWLDKREATFNQLKLIGTKRYLQSVNQSMPNLIEMPSDAVIAGVVIGSFKERNI